jgi:hypothetical protein
MSSSRATTTFKWSGAERPNGLSRAALDVCDDPWFWPEFVGYWFGHSASSCPVE